MWLININGKLVDSDFGNMKSSSVDGDLSFGRQTQILYGNSPDFTKTHTLGAAKAQIKAHPYSYHLLYELNNMMRGSKDEQLLSLLESFDKNVQRSKKARELREYIASRL